MEYCFSLSWKSEVMNVKSNSLQSSQNYHNNCLGSFWVLSMNIKKCKVSVKSQVKRVVVEVHSLLSDELRTVFSIIMSVMNSDDKCWTKSPILNQREKMTVRHMWECCVSVQVVMKVFSYLSLLRLFSYHPPDVDEDRWNNLTWTSPCQLSNQWGNYQRKTQRFQQRISILYLNILSSDRSDYGLSGEGQWTWL